MTKIDQSLRDEVLGRLDAGMSAPRVADWLERSRGVKVTPQAITKLARRSKGDAPTENATRSNAKTDGANPRSLDRLRHRARVLNRVVRRLESKVEGDPAFLESYFKGVELLRRMCEGLARIEQPAASSPVISGLADLLHAEIERQRDGD